MRRLGELVAVAATIACLIPGAAGARMGSPIHQLRIDGYVGPRAEGRREMADLVLRANGKDVSFQVTSASVITGNLHAATVFDRVRPYRPNFFLRGDRSMLSKVQHAAPGSHLRIQGHWRSGTRDLTVSSIEASPAHRAGAH
jgi:hypothetical protein